MNIIKFDLDNLINNKSGFNYYIIGRSYEFGENGACINYKRALNYYYLGLSINDPFCIYSIGICYILGLNNYFSIDLSKGNRILSYVYSKIVALINDDSIDECIRIYAKYIDGIYHYFGLGNVNTDKIKAYNIICDCAKKGHIGAIYALGGIFYYKGVGCKRDILKAKHYLEIASNYGLNTATNMYNDMERMF